MPRILHLNPWENKLQCLRLRDSVLDLKAIPNSRVQNANLVLWNSHPVFERQGTIILIRTNLLSLLPEDHVLCLGGVMPKLILLRKKILSQIAPKKMALRDRYKILCINNMSIKKLSILCGSINNLKLAITIYVLFMFGCIVEMQCNQDSWVIYDSKCIISVVLI